MITKVDKAKARKTYDKGETVWLLPSNVRFDFNSTWVRPYKISVKTCYGNEFDNIINEFAYYNCNSELGKSVHYYINSGE